MVEAVDIYRAQLRYEADPHKRLVALKFLVHFVGDVHTPLHVGYKRDRGGNDVAVEFFSQKTNLHRVWDALILRRDKATGKQLKGYAERLAASIKLEDAVAWRKLEEPAAWADEARSYLTSHVYRLPRDRRLGDEYQNDALPVVKLQLQRAGVRLAAVLNETFADAADDGCLCGTDEQEAVSPVR